MKLQISENARPDWDSQLCLLGGTIFNSCIWARYISAQSSHVTPLFITLLSDDDDVLGVALGFKQIFNNKLIQKLNRHRSLWFDAMPILADHNGDSLRSFLKLLEVHAHLLGCIELSIGSFASKDTSVEMIKQAFTLTKRIEFELNLDLSVDDLWQGMMYKRRKNINKALKQGVEIYSPPSTEGLRHLRRLQNETAQRISRRGGPQIELPKENEQNLDQDPLKILLELGFAEIGCAIVDEEVVSAGLFTFFNGLVYHNLSGHDRKAFETQAPTLLLWEMIKKYRKTGAKKFNLSGCKATAANENSPEHGVYTYKEAFGATPIECYNGSKIIKKAWHTAFRVGKPLLAARNPFTHVFSQHGQY
jgi:hypothetical protein